MMALASGVATADAAIGNAALRLELRASASGPAARLVRVSDGFAFADGPLLFRSQSESAVGEASGLADARISAAGDTIVLTGRLGDLSARIEWSASRTHPWIDERISLRNRSKRVTRLADLEIGFTRSASGVEDDLATAIPFRKRATDPAARVHEFPLGRLAVRQPDEPESEPFEPLLNPISPVPGRHRLSEAWAWRHGESCLGIFRFCQEHLQFSVLSRVADEPGRLRFGGAVMHFGEPTALRRMKPGERIDLGVTRYQVVAGAYEDVAYAYRDLLDANGCRFPASYDAPIHWEQLYDMEGAWDDRAGKYTRAALEREAEKGVAYSCEALYLDPGWDTAFASFLWGEQWIGPQRDFVRELKERYGLGLALHTPLATWMSMKGWSMGPFAPDAWPAAARRAPLASGAASPVRVPAVRDGRRNLALLPEAKASASSVWEDGKMAIHQIAHLNDGWYGNAASWIAREMPCWVEIDLGGVYRIDEVRLGNDALGQYSDRVATDFRILVADASGAFTPVLEKRGEALHATASYRFAPIDARRVRIEITGSDQGVPRLDEVEVYEASPAASDVAAAFEKGARRGPEPEQTTVGALVCLGSKQYLDEAERRLNALCDAGAVFLMFDGDWWPGTCWDRKHGHPVPYLPEDHIRACLELARRVHAKHPHVYIEMHDMLAGGSPARPTPVYYKYGLPGSYDDNWGLELMWDPMADLREGRADALYYYNLACNVPIYLHIDLRKDNRNCVVLWWYASTCRHLGIGGTNQDAAVVAAEQQAMRFYRDHERFYKRGDFYGAGREVHAHALKSENACVVNVFNLQDLPKRVVGAFELSRLGLDPAKRYRVSAPWARVRNGVLTVDAELQGWDARVCEVTPQEL